MVRILFNYRYHITSQYLEYALAVLVTTRETSDLAEDIKHQARAGFPEFMGRSSHYANLVLLDKQPGENPSEAGGSEAHLNMSPQLRSYLQRREECRCK